MSERRSHDIQADVTLLGEAGRRSLALSAGAAVIGVSASVGLAAYSDGGWGRFFQSYLVSYTFFLSLALGALFFVLVQHATRAGWSVVIRRLAENVAANLFLPMAVLVLPILFGLRDLYEWSRPEAVAADHLLQAKAAYLNVPFFLVRTLVYFASWAFIAIWFLRRSVRQDTSGSIEDTVRMEKMAAAGLLVFALTTTFFSFDYLMSLDARWFSTIFGVYFFAGSAVGFFALLPILSIWLQRSGRLKGTITAEHYHDMGKLVFAFMVFWTYIAFSQFMLIWYANIPEETGWFLIRRTGGWTLVSLFLFLGHFLFPFFLLMSRTPKRRRGVLAAAAGWMLFMHWVDLYWLVLPQASRGKVPLGPMDLACFLAVGGIFFAFALSRMARHALIPLKDPRLQESLGFENV